MSEQNWREIDTSTYEGCKQLDRVIAERLGWTAFSLECNGRVGWNFDYGNGKRGNLCVSSEEALWFTFLGDWSRDVNAAMELADGYLVIERGRLLHHDEPVWRAKYGLYQWEKADTAALAICKSWLAYDDRDRRLKAAQS